MISDLKKKLVEKSESLGFVALGFAQARRLDREIEIYKERLASGYFADMKYLGKYLEKRADPRNLLPKAKTVIVAAAPYNFDLPDEIDPEDFSGKVSRYALGIDYHKVLPPKLEKIATEIPNAKSRIFVDTGLVLEKVWAERAGIGFIGKNSCLINPVYGSHLFLGIILTEAEIKPDAPIENLCGDCEACLTACPTGALVDPGVLDSRKCLSYWTIEAKAKAEIPNEIARNSKEFVFGCDVCQRVCPINRKAKKASMSEFLPKRKSIYLSESYVESLSNEEFNKTFAGSPISRPKRAGILRNFRALKIE